jgi:hypothetical protein
VKVKVFISWSGEPSRSIALALHNWLETVAQHVQPWMSEEAIESGRRWNEEIARALDDTDFGIVCVTAQNQHAPWLMFEAGALARRVGVGRVVPLRIHLTNAQLKEPLASFQGVELTKEGMRRLVQDIMRLRDDPLSPAQVIELFEDAWPRFEAKVNEAIQRGPDVEGPPRSQEEILEELLEGVRRLERVQSREVSGTATAALGRVVADATGGQDAVVRFIEGSPPPIMRQRS